MSPSDSNPPRSKEWRDRADEYRAYAVAAQSPEGRASYLEIVAGCDEIAERLEKHEGAERPI